MLDTNRQQLTKNDVMNLSLSRRHFFARSQRHNRISDAHLRMSTQHLIFLFFLLLSLLIVIIIYSNSASSLPEVASLLMRQMTGDRTPFWVELFICS